MLLGLAVFVVAYALLAVPALPRLVRQHLPPSARSRRLTDMLLGRPAIAAVAAIVLVTMGVVTPWAAWAAVDFRTLALLLGMMLLVVGLEAANLLVVVAHLLARHLQTPTRLLAGSMVVVAILSALVLNDAVVLFFTPVLIRAARAMDVPAYPFLIGEAIAANFGSAATPVGNPQNAAIALAHGFTFATFSRTLAPLAIVALLIGIFGCWVAFRRVLATGTRADSTATAPRVARPMLVVAGTALTVAFAGFVVGPRFGIPLWASALAAGTLVLAAAPLARVSPLRVAQSVDGGILVFFTGLFILVHAVKDTPLIVSLAGGLANFSVGGFVLGTAVLSNVVSNVPAVLLLLPHVTDASGALLLAASSTFAGNATFLGSAATLIVAETARSFGAEFPVGRFMLVGFPLTVAVLWVTVCWWS